MAAATSTPSKADPNTTIIIGDDESYNSKHFVIPPQYAEYIDHVLIPHGMIVDRIKRMAQFIFDDYMKKGKRPHIFAVLKGGHAFFTDLTRAIGELQVHSASLQVPFTFDFIRAKSYEGTHSTGEVKISGASPEDFAGRHIILVEDIVDTGATMHKLVPQIKGYGAKSVAVATLLTKRNPEAVEFKADYVGFDVPDKFVVGYNLDYNEAFREMSHVCVINKAGIDKFADFDKEVPTTPLARD